MRIALKDITEHGIVLDFTEKESWVRDTVERVDEEPSDTLGTLRPNHLKQTPADTKNRPIQVHFNLRKVDEVIIADGNIRTQIHLNCSRCVIPFDLACESHFTALYSRDPEMSGINDLRGSNGTAKSAHDDSAGQDLEITYLTQDFIDLSETLAEQLMLQVPFQPLCQTACKGICQTCGTDLNKGRCACEKVAQQSPFSVLKDFQARKP